MSDISNDASITRSDRRLIGQGNTIMIFYENITGNTFAHKDALKKMGGRWNAEKKCWQVPNDRASEARKLVSSVAPISPVRLDLVAHAKQNMNRAKSDDKKIHPDALTKSGNNGFGPSSVAYDDV